jgi:hypothetical protein
MFNVKPNTERKESEMKREKIIIIEVKEVKKDWIDESINNIEYGYDPELFDEELIEDLRDCIQGREVK